MESLEAFVSLNDKRSAFLKINSLSVLERNIRQLLQHKVQVILHGSEEFRNVVKELCQTYQLSFVDTADVVHETRCFKISGDVQYRSGFIKKAIQEVRNAPSVSHFFELSDDSSVPFEWIEATPAQKIHIVPKSSCHHVEQLLKENSEVSVRKKLSKDLFDEIYENTEGWIARGLNKRISFAITPILLKLPITPNQITIFCFFLGAAGCAMLFHPSHHLRIFGAMLLQMNSILDGCDGEVARLRVQTSRSGAWMDTVSDDVLNNLMFACLSFGYLFENFSFYLLKFIVLTIMASLGVSFFLYHFMITNNDPNAAHFKLSWQKEEEKLASHSSAQLSIFDRVKPILKRDFVILFVLVAVILDFRILVVGFSGLIWIAFLLYMFSFFHSFARRRNPTFN